MDSLPGTLNQRVRGSSPWRLTAEILAIAGKMTGPGGHLPGPVVSLTTVLTTMTLTAECTPGLRFGTSAPGADRRAPSPSLRRSLFRFHHLRLPPHPAPSCPNGHHRGRRAQGRRKPQGGPRHPLLSGSGLLSSGAAASTALLSIVVQGALECRDNVSRASVGTIRGLPRDESAGTRASSGLDLRGPSELI